MPRRRPPDPRQLLLPAGPPRAPSFARVFEVDPARRVALTPELALAFRADYREALRAVREAGDYREARAARDAMRDLGAVYFAYMAALQASLRAPDVRPEVADQFMRGVLLSRLAFTVPFDEARDAVGRRVAYGSFMRARGPWEIMAWRAASRAFENLERYAGNLPRTLHLAREERVMVAGVPVGVGPMDRATAARALDVLDAALRILREQRRVPWLLSRLPPIAITSECERSGVTMQGEYDPATRRILICAGSMLGATPLAVAHTIAHEAGHHLWRTSLSDAAQDAWRREVALAVERVPVRAVLALWPEGDTLDDVVRRLRTLNPPLSLALQGAHERGSLRGWTKREAWTAWLARDPNAAVDLSSAPVSAYGAKDPEEAFCEALGLLAAYGLRAVLPEVAQWLRAVVPAVRPKGNRRPMPRKRNSAIARRHKRNAAPTAAGYEPDPDAPALGEWDRSGKEPRWRQGHESLVRDALRSWKGDPITMRLHITDEREREPEPGSGTGKILRAQARALLWELAHHARPSPAALHRGSHIEPNGIQSWSEKRRVASSWASRNGGRVFTLPKGTRGLRVLDYTSSAFDSEAEWVVDVDTLTKANGHQRRHKGNSARAAREMMREEPYTETTDWGETRTRTRREEYTVPAHVTPDHWTDPATLAAIAAARNTQQGYNKRLGAGNFGIGYRADTPSGPRLVKLPAEHNLHEQPWSRAQQTAHIMHEAGVANELSALGYSLIPRGVYTEWGGGTPAFVREFGEPVTSLTPAEYGAVEAELLSIERDHGWMVVDELQLYRRPDGSVYVGDVGLWQPPPRAKRAWSLRWSGLHRYLEDLQRRTLPGLAMRPRDARWVAPAPGYEHVDRIPVATLPLLVGHAERIREHAAQTSRKALALSQSFAVRAARSLIQGVSERDAHGIHTPDTVRAALPIAHEIAALPEDEDDE